MKKKLHDTVIRIILFLQCQLQINDIDLRAFKAPDFRDAY